MPRPPGIRTYDTALKEEIEELPAEFETTYELSSKTLRGADIVYWTRTQTERGAGTGDEHFRLQLHHLDKMSPEGIVMHPLPRVDELSTDIDNDPRARYFEQAANGLPLRMALLKMLLKP